MINIFYRTRYWFLLLTVATGVMVWPGVKTALTVDNSLAVWFLKNDPALLAYQHFGERFGNDEVVILLVKAPQTLLSPAYFQKFTALTQALENIPAVAQVIGPGNAQVPHRGAFGLGTQPLFTATAEPESVKKILIQRPLLREQLYTPDYRAARFVIVLKALPDFDDRRGAILDQVKATVYAHIRPEQAFLGGIGVIYAGLNALSQQDFGFFLGIGYLVMFFLFWYIYRNAWLLGYIISLVALATYLTLGIYGTLGFRLNLMTVLLPVLIILLGVMDAMHVINEQHQLDENIPPKEAALLALQRVFKPCLFTTLTNMAGFLALVSSPMAILQIFGYFAALGIFLCLFLTYLLGVFILPLTRSRPRTTRLTGAQLARFYLFLLARKKLFGSLSLGLILLFAGGIFRLQSDTYTLGYFPDDHPVVKDHQVMQAAWGPYLPLELFIQPRAGRTLYDPEVVRAAINFSDSVQTLPGIGRVFGFSGLYQTSLENQNRKLLQSKGALKQVYRQLKLEYPALFTQFVHEPSNTGRITISGAMVSARELTAKMDTVLQVAGATLGPVATVRPAGYQPLYANIVRYVTDSQINSLLLSFITIFLLVWVFIRSFKLAGLTVIPNLFPVLVLLGVMGWSGIHLDTATASIAAIVLSFCVDDTIHFIYTYRQHRRAGQNPAAARLATITHVGPAIVLTAMVLFFGYIFMIFGSLQTVQLWGLLTACALAGALYGELIIFPIILEKFDRQS